MRSAGRSARRRKRSQGNTEAHMRPNRAGDGYRAQRARTRRRYSSSEACAAWCVPARTQLDAVAGHESGGASSSCSPFGSNFIAQAMYAMGSHLGKPTPNHPPTATMKANKVVSS